MTKFKLQFTLIPLIIHKLQIVQFMTGYIIIKLSNKQFLINNLEEKNIYFEKYFKIKNKIGDIGVK